MYSIQIIQRTLRGHHDKNASFYKLPIPSQLNILMNRLSKKLVDYTCNAPDVIIPLPTQRIYLKHHEPIVHCKLLRYVVICLRVYYAILCHITLYYSILCLELYVLS